MRLFILVILLKIRFLHQIGSEVHFVLILAFARKHFHRNSRAPNHVCCHGYQRHLQGRLHLVWNVKKLLNNTGTLKSKIKITRERERMSVGSRAQKGRNFLDQTKCFPLNKRKINTSVHVELLSNMSKIFKNYLVHVLIGSSHLISASILTSVSFSHSICGNPIDSVFGWIKI